MSLMSWQTERAKPNKTFGFYSFSGDSQPECQSAAKRVLCVELSSRDKKRDSTRLQVEMLERNESIRSFHTQRIDLYFCDKEPNHRSVWSLSFLSSCLSLLEHTHKHQMLPLLADDRGIVWWVSDMFHPENSVSRWLITQFMSN